jgi:hypothetical protein
MIYRKQYDELGTLRTEGPIQMPDLASLAHSVSGVVKVEVLRDLKWRLTNTETGWVTVLEADTELDPIHKAGLREILGDA